MMKTLLLKEAPRLCKGRCPLGKAACQVTWQMAALMPWRHTVDASAVVDLTAGWGLESKVWRGA